MYNEFLIEFEEDGLDKNLNKGRIFLRKQFIIHENKQVKLHSSTLPNSKKLDNILPVDRMNIIVFLF